MTSRHIRKKYLIIAGFLAVLIILPVITVMLMLCTADKEEKERTGDEQIEETEEKEEAGEEKNGAGEKILFAGFEKFEPCMSQEKILEIEDEILVFISQDNAYSQSKEITCVDVSETENKFNFYCTFDQEPGSILYGVYDKESEQLLQWTEQISLGEATEKWQAEKEEIIDTSDWEEEEKLPEEWDYVEEERGDSG